MCYTLKRLETLRVEQTFFMPANSVIGVQNFEKFNANEHLK